LKSNRTEIVKVDTVYPQTQEHIWRAITDSHELAKWMMPNDFEPTVGHRFTFFDPRGDKIRCQVVYIENGRLLAYTWQHHSDEEATVVTWTLEAVEDGTRVRITHAGSQGSMAKAFGLSNDLRRFLTPPAFRRGQFRARNRVWKRALTIKSLSGQKPAPRRVLK